MCCFTTCLLDLSVHQFTQWLWVWEEAYWRNVMTSRKCLSPASHKHHSFQKLSMNILYETLMLRIRNAYSLLLTLHSTWWYLMSISLYSWHANKRQFTNFQTQSHALTLRSTPARTFCNLKPRPHERPCLAFFFAGWWLGWCMKWQVLAEIQYATT